MALSLITDWGIRLSQKELFYSFNGGMPAALNPLASEPWHFSIFYLGTSPFILNLCFFFGLLAYIGFALGLKPRLFALLSLVFQVSLANRNIYPGFCTDIMSAILLWFVVAPKEGPVRGWPLYGYLTQLGLIYSASGFAKITPNSEWLDGTAMSWVARYTNITNSLGELLGSAPGWFQKSLTFGVLGMELLALPLLLLPWTRNSMIVALLIFHLGTLFTMNLGEMPLLMMGCLLVAWSRPKKMRSAEIPSTEPEPLSQLRIRLARRVGYAVATIVLLGIILSDAYNRVGVPTLQRWSVNAKSVVMPVPAVYFAGLVRIRQTWTMFSSPLPKTLVWPVIACTTMSGEQFNLINGLPLNWQAPEGLAYYYDHRLYKYYNALYGFHAEGKKELVNACGEFLVRDWNGKHPDKTLQHIGIWFGFAPTTNRNNVNWAKIY